MNNHFLNIYSSLGCGIGYGYLHRIPAHPAQPNIQNTSVLQPAVTGGGEEVASLDHVEAQVIITFVLSIKLFYFIRTFS